MNDLSTQENINLIKSIEDFTKKLNIAPKQENLQKTPDGKADYLPISFIETQLREDFMGLVQYEVVSERREINEYIVVARIKVFHPIIRQWMSYDGIGSGQIMQDSGTTLQQFTEAKKKNALEMGAPKVYAEAIKNAAKKIGKKYGADLNRKFEDFYEATHEVDFLKETLDKELTDCLSLEEIDDVLNKYRDLVLDVTKKRKHEYGEIVNKHKHRVTNK